MYTMLGLANTNMVSSLRDKTCNRVSKKTQSVNTSHNVCLCLLDSRIKCDEVRAEWFHGRVVQDGEYVPEADVPGLWKTFQLACGSPTGDVLREAKVWSALEKVVPFLRGEVYVENDETGFRDAINAFTDSFVACWGEGHITHYMHILYAHGPWFLKEHGSLGVWQCQGMEKSHWRARGNW